MKIYSSRIKKSFAPVFLPVMSALLVVASIYFSFVGRGAVPVIAAGNQSAQAAVPNRWIQPIDVSHSPWYDNTSSIAAAPDTGAVTIAWEQRDETIDHTFGQIMECSNAVVNDDFLCQAVQRTGWKQIGNVKVAVDAQGRRHMVFYRYDGSNATCGVYATVEADGGLSTIETIPDSCYGFYKPTAIAVGPDLTVHIILARDNTNLHYYERTAAGDWVVRDELISEDAQPSNPSITVSSNGVVMAAWTAVNGKRDVFTGIRSQSGNWDIEDISAECCSGCDFDSNTYAPALTPDKIGGIRAVWADEECPHATPRNTDIYYREWVPGTGWDNQPLVLVAGNSGQQFWAGVAVDNNNLAHITYGTDEGRGRDNYTMGYIFGSGTNFSEEDRPIESSAYVKEPAIAHSNGFIHASFNSNQNDSSYKDTFYTNQAIADGTVATPGPVTPSPTNTPVSTNTPVATSTPVATATPICSDRFKDVCPGDYFYYPVLHLDDAHVMSGYDTTPPCLNGAYIPCFLPYNNITRGQAAKIIALGANLPANLAGAPHFTDVPDTNTFYEFIEYSYNAGVITGYACGGPNEPCDSQNRAYFRPGSDVTRGQLSKMISTAFGYNNPVTGQTFEDVSPNSTFYQWIERIASREIIGGYPCGTQPFEPCVAPNNRPYFRPGSNVIRGQAAKILDGARQQVPTPTPTPTLPATATPLATSTGTAVATGTAIATGTSTVTVVPGLRR